MGGAHACPCLASCPAAPMSCSPWSCPGAGAQQRHFRSRWATSWETPAALTSLDS